MTLRPFIAAAKIAATILLAQSFAAGAAEIKVLSAGGIRPPLEELIPQFERASAHKVATKFVGGPAVKREIDAGGVFDLIIAPPNVIEDLIKAGKVAPATRADVARAGVGVGVRAGAPKPDIASVEAFKRTLLGAKSVAFARDGTAGTHFQGVLERLGISKEMEPKLKRTTAADPANSAAKLVERGEAEVVVAAVATLFTPGIDFIGPLPSEFQTYIHFAAAVGTGAREPQAAAALINFVTAPAAAAAFKAKGMEPAPHR
jgi:molybdate transport system substrate-binding protein